VTAFRFGRAEVPCCVGGRSTSSPVFLSCCVLRRRAARRGRGNGGYLCVYLWDHCGAGPGGTCRPRGEARSVGRFWAIQSCRLSGVAFREGRHGAVPMPKALRDRWFSRGSGKMRKPVETATQGSRRGRGMDVTTSSIPPGKSRRSGTMAGLVETVARGKWGNRTGMWRFPMPRALGEGGCGGRAAQPAKARVSRREPTVGVVFSGWGGSGILY